MLTDMRIDPVEFIYVVFPPYVFQVQSSSAKMGPPRRKAKHRGAFSPVQGGVTTQGRQIRQIPLSPPSAARHLYLQQQLQQQDIMLPPKHGTWSASHLQQMYAQLPQSSSPPVMMAMPVKQGIPPQPVLPMAHPLPPVSTRMKPPPPDPSAHQYPQYQPHPHSNGQPDDSYSPHSQHLPLTPQYCEAAPLPPLTGHPAMLSVAPPPAAVPAPMVGPPAPPPPPGPPPPMAVPPPMPPPLPTGGGPPGGPPGVQHQPSGLAAALAGAKLRKVHRDESSPPGSGGKSDSNRSSGGSGGGGEGLMQEMNALLARRRKASEKPDEDDSSGRQQNSTDAVKKPWERSNSADKSSLVSRVRPVGSTSESDTEFDRMKQEILDEVVRELHKVKDEIINVGGEREEELEEDGHADAQTRGPGECSLNVSVTSRCHEASCRDVVPTFESAGQRKWKKEKQRRGESGFMRQRSRGNGKMDKESLKGLMNSNRGGKIY
ncbi:Vasodilator-stimulated phosphoprotein [Collichthys lucidus]|uniref:Vasodilator-stimulated phosphoprotein n=1 Tax=Collichthys lucidus TaxID=240159 RepID=A0A4U5VEX9_COLLU|nr:Vasodilator-stimulated phosphoprotein [Collichthys lucidus]